MKNFKKVSILFLLLSLMVFTACSNKTASGNKQTSNEKKTIKIGSIAFNHDEVAAKSAVEALKAKGYTVECLVFENATVMNEAILDGSLDTTLHEHKPWMDNFNKQKKTNLVMLTPYIHYNEYSIMSSKYKKVQDIPDGAKITISDDGSNQCRALLFLKELGLIELREGATVPTVLDITKNPHNFKITPIQHHQVVASMPDVDACMTSTYLLLSNKVSMDTVIASSKDYKEYGVGFVVRDKDKDSQWAKDLMAAYTTAEMRQQIKDLFKGGFIPGF